MYVFNGVEDSTLQTNSKMSLSTSANIDELGSKEPTDV